MDLDAITDRLSREPGLRLAVLFGSAARGTQHAGSDLDLGLDFTPQPTHERLGTLVADLESTLDVAVDLTLLNEVGPSLAHRIAREGRVLVCPDRQVWVHFVHRAIVDYLDWKPTEKVLVDGVLRRAARMASSPPDGR